MIDEKIAEKQLKVIKVPESEDRLHEVSAVVEISDIMTPGFQKFLDNMMQTMLTEPMAPGWEPAGISAIQVDVPLRVFIAREYKSFGGGKYLFYINPEIEYLGSATDEHDESCMSIPKTIGPVRRHKRIKITYFDRNGIRQTKKLSGFTARVVQHEYDHLQGILFTDKLEED